MAEFYVGQIMMTGFPFAQKYFAQCNGQLMGISQNQALFSLLGVAYGGDGRVTFALPNLQGRTPVGAGPGQVSNGLQPYPFGTASGVENVTVLQTEMPMHDHLLQAATALGNQRSAAGNVRAGTDSATVEALYAPAAGANVVLAPDTVSMVGGNQPHPNMQPFRVINFNIALQGIFPSRN